MANDFIAFRRDRWLYALPLAETPAPLYRGADTSDPVTATLPAQTYYAIASPAPSEIPAAQRLFTALASALQTALGSGTVTIRAQDSATEGDIGASRIILRWTGGAWAIRPNQASGLWALLGFAASDAEARADAAGDIFAPKSYRGAWWSDNPFGGGALIKQPVRLREVAYSSERLWEAATIVWGDELVRTIRYALVPAARVLKGRAHDARRAKLAHLAQGDTQAELEPLYTALTLTDGAPVYLCHDVDLDDGLTIPLVAQTTRFERVTLWEPVSSMGDLIQEEAVAGDWYTVTLTVRVTPNVGGYVF